MLLDTSYQKALVLIDEAYNYFESRLSQSNENILGSILLFQSRKKGLNLILTIQDFSSLDVRYRNLVDFRIKAEVFNEYECFRYIIRHKNKRYIVLITFDEMKEVFEIYDTYQLVINDRMKQMIDLYSSQDSKINLVLRDIDKFPEYKEEYNISNKTTNQDIKGFCLKYKLPTKSDFITMLRMELKKRGFI